MHARVRRTCDLLEHSQQRTSHADAVTEEAGHRVVAG